MGTWFYNQAAAVALPLPTCCFHRGEKRATRTSNRMTLHTGRRRRKGCWCKSTYNSTETDQQWILEWSPADCWLVSPHWNQPPTISNPILLQSQLHARISLLSFHVPILPLNLIIRRYSPSIVRLIECHVIYVVFMLMSELLCCDISSKWWRLFSPSRKHTLWTDSLTFPFNSSTTPRAHSVWEYMDSSWHL